MMMFAGTKTSFGLSRQWASGGVVALLLLGACKEEETAETCVTDEVFFQERVYANIMVNDCATCHNPTGQAKDSEFVLVTADWGPDYLERNLEMFKQMAKIEYEGQPWVLLKPTGQLEHPGGVRFAADSEQYAAFEEMIARLENPTVCEATGDPQAEFFADVELLDEVATLRKAMLSLAGRLPTVEEEQRVRDGGFEALDTVLDEVMAQPVFDDRIKEIFNDHFLTDRYYFGTEALDLLNEEVYPNRYWYESLPEDQIEEAQRFSNAAVAREALELVAHVVRNDLPYTEVLTADYTMVNPYSARVFGVEPNFVDPKDYREFVPAKVPGIPHAGVLTSTVWLNRFPTTDTNRNRHRARMLYEFFLATDVQALGDRPVDAASIADHNPTMNNPQCAMCHTIIDPVAGAFQNWDEMGVYTQPEGGWYADMRPAGFGDALMPASESHSALRWLVGQVIADPRFAISPVHIVFKGLAGQKPLREPTNPNDEGYLENMRAARVQQQIFNQIAQKFAESNYNLKVVVKEIVKSPYYRAFDAAGLDEVRERELLEVGTGRLLTPEQLNRKITAVTGYPWRGGADDDDYLLDADVYRIFYGGIDSDTVVERITEINGIMANVAKRMANEMSCLAVPQDFAKDPSDRIMFPLVEADYEPEDGNGFEVPAAAAAIRANIQYLHQRMLGEYLDLNDPEINRTYELYLSVWKDGQRGLATGEYDPYLPGLCRAEADYWTDAPYPEEQAVVLDDTYTVRAWMAVMTYMLSDYRFLHE